MFLSSRCIKLLKRCACGNYYLCNQGNRSTTRGHPGRSTSRQSHGGKLILRHSHWKGKSLCSYQSLKIGWYNVGLASQRSRVCFLSRSLRHLPDVNVLRSIILIILTPQMLRPVQTKPTCWSNIIQHCWMQHVGLF